MSRIIQGLFLYCVFASGAALAMPLQDCNALASELNKMTPMQVDKITLWKTTACLPQGRNVVLTYIYLLDVDKGQVSQTALDSLRPAQLASWCTNPQQRQLINLYDVQYQYSSRDSTFIGKLEYSAKLCK